MDSSKEIDNILKKLYDSLEKLFPEEKEIDYKKYLERSGLINLLNNQQGTLILLVDVKKLNAVYISGSVEDYTGYKLKEFEDNVALNFMNLVNKKHLTFLNVFIFWIINMLKTLPVAFKTKQNVSMWGLKLMNKNGREMRWFMNVIPLELDSNFNATLVFLTIQNITHLIKGDDYCFRGVFGDKEKKVFVYHSSEEKSVEHEIISEREKEVLNYISQGLDTKQIADLLKISPNTVDNHRRNMLAKTCTRDTTALIQLCRMMGII